MHMYLWKIIVKSYLFVNKKNIFWQSFWHYILSRGSELNNMLIWLIHVCIISLIKGVYMYNSEVTFKPMVGRTIFSRTVGWRNMIAQHWYRTTRSSHINFLEHGYLQNFEYLLVGESSLDHRPLGHSLIFMVHRLYKQFCNCWIFTCNHVASVYCRTRYGARRCPPGRRFDRR